MFIAPFQDVADGRNELRRGILREAAPPRRPRLGLRVAVDVQDVPQRVESRDAVHTFRVAPARAEVRRARRDPQLRIARADSARHRLENFAIRRIVILGRLVADLHGFEQRLLRGRAKCLGECEPVCIRITLHIFPSSRRDVVEHKRGVRAIPGLLPASVELRPVHTDRGKWKRRRRGGIVAKVPFDRMIISEHASDRRVQLRLELHRVDIEPDEVLHQRTMPRVFRTHPLACQQEHKREQKWDAHECNVEWHRAAGQASSRRQNGAETQ